MAIAGRVAIVPKGDYVNGTQYKRLDLVTYNGDGYVAKLDNINVVPEDGDTWMLAWHGAATDVTERISNLENLILPANTALNKNFETDASAYKENGTASVGTSENISRSDHVHPTDQTRLSKDGDSQNNTVTFTSNDTSTSDTWTDVAVLATGEKHSSLFAKISTMFKNIRYIYTHFIKSENILETLEEIVANTQSGKVAGALAVKELNSNFYYRTAKLVVTSYSLSFDKDNVGLIIYRVSNSIHAVLAVTYFGTIGITVEELFRSQYVSYTTNGNTISFTAGGSITFIGTD